MSYGLVIVLAKKGRHYCVLDVVPHTSSNDIAWNKNERYQPSSGGGTGLISSKWYRDKNMLSPWTRIEKKTFEKLHGKVPYP